MANDARARHFFGGVVGIKLPHHRVWAGDWFDVDVYGVFRFSLTTNFNVMLCLCHVLKFHEAVCFH